MLGLKVLSWPTPFSFQILVWQLTAKGLVRLLATKPLLLEINNQGMVLSTTKIKKYQTWPIAKPGLTSEEGDNVLVTALPVNHLRTLWRRS